VRAVLDNAMRLQALRAAAHTVVSRIGLVTNYDPTRYMAKVALQPDGSPTGWLPIDSNWVGNGWGMYCPPSINEMVTVVFIDGKLNTGYVQARHYNNQDRPLTVPSGEFWLVHVNGQFLKLTNDGKLTVSDGQGASVVLNGDGTITSAANTWNHTGDINVIGALDVSQNVTCADLVTDVMSSANAHDHGGVMPGDGNTGGPTG
jgi:phage baseplate assembly protein gpV